MAVQIIVRRGGRPGGVPPGPSDVTTLHTLNWTSGLGTSTYAWTDGDASRSTACLGGGGPEATIIPTVLAAVDEGWSGPGNVLRMQNTAAGCGGVHLLGLMPPHTGDDWWILRWSYKQDEDQIYHVNHTLTGFSPYAVATGKMVLNGIRRPTGGTDGLQYVHIIGLAPADHGWEMRQIGNLSAQQFLLANTWYRFEMALNWLGLDGSGNRLYRLYPRVYDPAGNLIATEANYVSDWTATVSTGGLTMAAHYAAGGHLIYPAGSLNSTEMGQNPRDFFIGISQSKRHPLDNPFPEPSIMDPGGHYFWAGVDIGVADQQAYYGPYS